jgi:hypothetical protein
MSGQVSVDKLASQIRAHYRTNGPRAETLIETYLEERLEGCSPEKKLALLEELRKTFEPSQSMRESPEHEQESEVFSALFSLILGQRISSPEIGSKDLVQRLARALNNIFDHLNELVSIIRSTFGEEDPALETIRHLIGSDLGSENQSGSLESYIGQIKESFLIGEQAFKLAAHNEVGKLLAELDPDHISAEAEKGMRFGFMRKAEFFEAYREKFGQIKKWFESERFLEDFSREFERACQRLNSEKGRVL